MATVVIVTGLFAACAPRVGVENASQAPPPVYLGTNVFRIVDTDAGVVCWVVSAYNRSGISCLPLEETLLDGGR